MSQHRGTGGPTIERRTVLKSIGVASAIGVGAGNSVGHALGLQDAEYGGETVVRGSVEQVHVVGATPGATLVLENADGEQVAEVTADEFGSYAFRDVVPASGYTVTEIVDGDESVLASDIEVLSMDDHPSQSFYDEQELEAGFNYIETRDGTTLACQVKFPDADEWGDPPYPVVIDYSGYAPSTNFWDNFDGIFNDLGYAAVGVNQRGTACSGGKFDFTEPLNQIDGYDMVEAVAAQEWAGNVGLAGKSYPGYTQLYVAATQPPSLAAIAPGHPVGDFYRDVGYPGGIRNVTYAQTWAGQRDADATAGGDRGNVDQRIANGDEICEANQRLRGQNRSLVDTIENTPYFEGVFEERSAWNLVGDIEAPTMLGIAWQDGSVGSRPARLLEVFSEDTPTRLIGSNGDHGEYYGQAIFEEIQRFYAYYLKEEVPEGDTHADLEDYQTALAAYENEDPVHIFWELDRDRLPRFESTFGEWPPGDTWELYFQPDGTLGDEPPTAAAYESTSYEYVPTGFLFQLIGRDDEGRLEWERQNDGEYVTFVSEPLDEDMVCLGSGLVELWLRSTAEDTDLQATLSEIRPDDQEMLVQSGWLRASHRAENPDRTKPRRPWQTHREDDTEPLAGDEFAHMRVELFPFGHVFREGARVAISIEAPTGNREQWGFDVIDEEATNEVAHSEAMPSKLELPLVPDAPVDAESLPECGSVREQPCRPVNVDDLIRDIDDSDGSDDEGDEDSDGDSDDDNETDGGNQTDGANDTDDGNQTDDDSDGSDGDGFGPGIGIGGAVASLGGAAYLVKRRLISEAE